VSDTETPRDVRQFVVFVLGDEEYGLPIARVSSIVKYEKATPVPHAPKEVEGVINLRGQVIPVVDLKARFSRTPMKEGSAERIVVCEMETGLVGLAVDAASEVVSIPLEDIHPAPESALTEETVDAFEGVAGLGDRLIILIRLDKAIPHSDYTRLADNEGDRNG